MMILNAKPLIGVNDVIFGMKRSEVRACFGKFKEFKKSKISKNTTDDFGFCHVFYTEDDLCEAIEIFNEAEVYIDEIKIFPTNKETLIKKFPDLIEDNDGYISKEQSVGVYAPYGDMEGILFGVKNYYK